MAERTHIPSSPACGQWETLLADALDGLLRPEDEATFSAHMAGCNNCATLFEEARQGREWLEFLSPEPEVPAGLLDKLLAQTGPGQVAGYRAGDGRRQRACRSHPAWQRPGFMARVRRFAEPRLLMTAAMAFFSIALTLNLTGVRLTGSGSPILSRRRSFAVWSGASPWPRRRSFATTTTFALCTRSSRGCGSCAAPRRTRVKTRQPRRQPRDPANQSRIRTIKTADPVWILRNSRGLPYHMIHLIIWRHRFHPSDRASGVSFRRHEQAAGIQIPRKQDGKGAQYGLRKS